ncbi:hypothetical protein [Lactiplantibacillus songbeiensis]|uniref:D-alanyl-D-alanine carboxypeptidase n=1 Tax=Lactiplantibacillus songbeiensis TaxID=2559920 RepID=A0ABW4C436_9LACO|nr:hypothetical protein [Lactiplantibacillus songbeiensis]
MKLGKVLLLTAAVLGAVGSLSVTDVQAKTGYQRTKNLAVKPKAFYSTSKHGATYQANGSLTNFKFKKNHALTHYRDSTWVATSKTYIKMHGKHRLYYYVHNSDGKAKGWVWNGYLKAGKHNQMRHEASKQVGNYVMAKPGKLYQFGGGYRAKHFNPFNIRFKHGIKLSDKVTYKRTQLWTVYKHGKASKYYYVTSSDNQVKGWVWHGFLKPGEVKEAAKKPAPAVTKPSGGSTHGQGVAGGTTKPVKPTIPVQVPKPIMPSEKPNINSRAWLKDDGKRKRIIVQHGELLEWLDQGNSYDLGIYIERYFRSQPTRLVYVKNIFTKIEDDSPYAHTKRMYAIKTDGTQVLGDWAIGALANGDILEDSRGFSSVNPPEIHTKYPIHDSWKGAYIDGSPTWTQYSSVEDRQVLWMFNLKKQQWEKPQWGRPIN